MWIIRKYCHVLTTWIVLRLLATARCFQAGRDGAIVRRMHSMNADVAPSSSALRMATDGDKNKFDFGQRVESVKCLVVGALVGGLVLSPLAAIHDIALLPMLEPNIPLNGIGQWEFDTDLGALQAGLFAIVYRYCVRKDGKTNPQLGQGVVGAFAVTRALGGVVVPSYCIPISLYCGPPLGYLDWSMLGQIAASGVESAIMFGATASFLDYSMEKGYISRFP